MRVIAGKYRSRLLQGPKGSEVTRPTADRVKESLFNIIRNRVQDAVVVDLFSGTGALGIEALSRGAKSCLFVESNSAAAQIIAANLRTLGVPREQFVILQEDVSRFLSRPLAARRLQPGHAEYSLASIGLFLADPPYQSNWYDRAIEEIRASELCARECLVVLERSRAATREMHSSRCGFSLMDTRSYSSTTLEFWESDTYDLSTS